MVVAQDKGSQKEFCVSAVLEEVNRFSLQEFPVPPIGADEALLRVEMAGVCRTDASFYQGKTRRNLIPLILGHEILGHVAQIGEVAAHHYGARQGDRVVVESSIRCGNCRYCIAGDYQLCDNRRGYGTSMTLAIPPHLWGAYGQYMYIAPGSVVHKISPAVPAEAAVLACSVIADGIQWVRYIGGVKVGDVVVIQGAGQQGLAATVAAKESGAGLILVTGLARDRRRFELAKTLGADQTVDIENENPVERIRQASGGDLADVVVDVSGSPHALGQAVHCVRKGGCIIAASVVGQDTLIALPSDELLFKQVTLKFVYTSTAPAVRAAVRLIESRKYPLEKMVTHRFPLQDAERAVRTVAGEDPEANPVKVVITP
ncbi:MAG: alcohol dehydrogenase catalytic domain-containing protein [Acidobacteria bacterium]|nr:alcohol dehydrogenase catalytic domain-containing protein [Acidobacteriota bacterium]